MKSIQSRDELRCVSIFENIQKEKHTRPQYGVYCRVTDSTVIDSVKALPSVPYIFLYFFRQTKITFCMNISVTY